jgi:hypothetical protein
MALTKDKKTKVEIPKLFNKSKNQVAPIIVKKESTLMRISREMNEAAEKTTNDAKDKIKFEKNEKIRIRKIILPYLDNLISQIDEKDLSNFWTFPDRTGFKKLYKQTHSLSELQEILNENLDMYKNRDIVRIKIMPFHGENVGSSYEKIGLMLAVGIVKFYIDKNGIVNGNHDSYGLDFSWRYDDFKISKFSFKLLETIMQIVVNNKLMGPGIIGMSLFNVIKRITAKKIDIKSVLNPLAGV